MDILLLKTFLTVCDTGSFSGAAQELNSVQSNITSRIKRLEEHFGQVIFERGRGGARLNPFGERLQNHARDLIARFEAAERDLLDASGLNAPLRLGSMETTAAVRIPPLLKSFKAECPGVKVSLRTGPTAEMLSLVRERKIDAAFVAGPIDETRFRAVPAFEEKLVLVQSKMQDSTNALLAFRHGCSYRAIAESWLRHEGRSDTEIVDMGTLDGILGCVDAGMGFAVAPERAVRQWFGVKGLLLTDLPEAFGRTETLLVWRQDFQVTKGFEVLLDILR